MNERCQLTRWEGRGRSRREIRCPRPAAWTYINGDYRRLECDECAVETRRLIRHPGVIRLERIQVALAPDPGATGGGE